MRKKAYTDAELTQVIESVSDCKFVETYRKPLKKGSLRMLKLVCGCGRIFDVAWNKFNTSSRLPQRQCQECGKELRAAHHRKSDADYQREKAAKGIEIKNIEPYVKGHVPIRHICPSCLTDEWRPAPNNVLQGISTKCSSCSVGALAGNNKLTDEVYQQKKKELGISIVNVHKYINMDTPIWHICPECSGGWLVRPGGVLGKNSTMCTPCSYSLRNKYKTLSDEQVTSTLKANGLTWIYGEYTSNESALGVRCECGEVFEKKYEDIRSGWTRCSKCAKSISTGEHKIKQWLDANEYEYVHQQKFNNLRGKRKMPLSYDFGIYFKGKLILLVEYDGAHHFKPIYSWYRTEEEAIKIFNDVLTRDRRKERYAKSKGIPLIRLIGKSYENLDANLGAVIETIKQYANTEVSENITRHRNA